MTTLYTIEMRRDPDGPLWAFVSHHGTSLVTDYEERAGLFTEGEARSWIENSRMLIENGWRAKIRVATAEQLRRNSPEAAA